MIEEFAARRRLLQDAAIDLLIGPVKLWLADIEDAEHRKDLDEILSLLYADTYTADGGTRRGQTAAYLSSIAPMLNKSTKDSSPETVATWLAVATMNAAGVQAAHDNPAPTVMKWTTMHDSKVREAHRAADRQRRSPGSTFLVGGERLRYPGDPKGSLENTLNCRCVLQPVSVDTSALTAAAKEIAMATATPIPWHGVLAPENVWSGDGRRFAEGSLRNRDLPLPLTYQRASAEGHGGSVTVARIDSIERVDGMIRGEGVFLDLPETDEVVGLIAEFGRFGVSIDADDSEFEFDEESEKVTFTSARIASASIVAIPAFAEAFISIGTWADAGMPPKKKGQMDPLLEKEIADEEECDPEADDYEECLARQKAKKEPQETPPGENDGFVKVDPEPGWDANEIPFISDSSWDGSAGRFTPEQWKSSCILHVCDGLEKSCHKLPIKEPGGALSRAGVHAAASRFGQVDAPPEAKASAARALRGAYKQLGEEPPEAIAASLESFGRGPGWVTNPEDTKRLHDYWTKPGHAGYSKINWGVPGDFNRCRVEVGEEIGENSPTDLRFLNQICAQWHHDALGFWPGRAPSEQSLRDLNAKPADAVGLVASGGIKAPASWFQNPNLTEPTHLTVTEEGRVFGHIAEWKTCHIGFEGVCVAPPMSSSDYAWYASKRVLLDDGTQARTGVLSLGGGHAPGNMGFTAAIEHYDRTSSAVADVSVGEDEHGIWCAGWMRPGWTEKQAYDLRASDVSGDWREVRPGQMELVAALAVNVAGFPVVTVHDQAQVALVAAGVVQKRDDNPMDTVVREVVAAIARRDRMARLRERVGGK